MRKRRLKIIMDRQSELVPEHARRMLRALEQQEDKNPRYHMKPRGVAIHMAMAASVCDECGETFWARDPYATHKGCQGFKPHRVGF